MLHKSIYKNFSNFLYQLFSLIHTVFREKKRTDVINDWLSENDGIGSNAAYEQWMRRGQTAAPNDSSYSERQGNRWTEVLLCLKDFLSDKSIAVFISILTTFYFRARLFLGKTRLLL